MNILKRQLALLLVLAMTLTMLPMPAHADEVTEPETKSVIVEETTEKTVVSKEEVSTNVSKMPVESAEPEASSKESATSEAETPADTVEDSDATIAEELVANTSKDAPVSDSIEESESIINIDGTAAEDTEADEDKDYSATVESEEAEDSESDTQEATGQAEPMTDVPVAAVFSFRRSVANAVTSECAHSETEIAWDTKDQVINCKSISDTQHQISGYQYRYCTSCYQRVGESFAVTEVASHELDNSGYCSWCGYRSSTGSGSGSGSGSDPDSDPDCDHANTAIGWDPDQLGPWYAQYSDTQHKVTGYRYTYCTDCHARIRDESGSNNNYYSEEVEGHTLNASGECTLCGYGQKATCNHLRDSSSGEVSYTDPPRYEKCNEDTHYIYRPTYYDCIYCGEPMDEPGYTIRNEAHTPENGVCIYCGENVGKDYCFHSATDTAWDTTQPIYYSIYSSTQHQIRGFEYTYCTNCFERIGESFWSQQLEGHVLSADGVCTLCSYGSNTCAHENVVFGYAPVYDPPRYEQYDDSQHFVYHIMQKTCRDCGETLSDGEEAVSLENHVLDDGKCTYCGYGLGEDYCTHPGTDVAWDTNYPITYTKINNNDLSGTLHQAEGYQYHYCTSCYKRICDSFPVAEWENHIFDAAGDCTLCNYRVGCEHKQTTMKLYDTLYESLNKDSHEVTRLYSKVCADPDCGKVLVSVETSYTETDIEDHDFTGNTCLLCNYTVAAQLSATVTASAQTANKGDHISATATVVGGTGGYRFSWKILKDGSVVAENPITTSASCGTNASEEGSYVFQVTVTDSAGNTVTAQSGAITVSHACQYETVTSTELVIQSLTHHTVETTTYEECTICHEKRNEVTDVDWVEHTPIDVNSYGYEAAHPHKKYFICECGTHPYLEDQHETANGVVQEPDVCCICHGHKYGEEEETDEGTRQKTCINCGITMVTHTHDYKLIQTTKLVVQSETHHTVETTTYEECSNCHKKTEAVDDVIWEEHKAESTSHEAEHPHKKYFVCKCGAHPYIDGEYVTANGKVQEKSVCCICNGHKYGEAQEAADGTWKKICANCGLSQKVAAPVQPTEPTEPEEEKAICNHVYNTEGDGTKHPHTIEFACMRCMAEGSLNYKFNDCCQCVGHIWDSPVRGSDGIYKQGCVNCTQMKTVTPSAQVENFYEIVDIITERHNTAKEYQKEHEIDSASPAIWKTIARQAADALTKFWFVFTNELLDSEASAYNIVSVEKEIVEAFKPETWDEQQTEIWKTLIAQMLLKENESEDIDSWTNLAEGTKDAISNGKVALKAFDMAEGEKHERLGLFANIVGVLAEGAGKAAIADEYNKIIAELRVNEKNIEILQEIIDAASVSGNTNLVSAAIELQSDLREANARATDELISEGHEFLAGFVDKGLQWGLKELQNKGITAVVPDVLPYTAVVTIAAKSTDLALGWGPIYDEAQLLMTLNVMDANMDIASVLKSEDSPYMAKLWGELQVEGCNCAQDLLNTVEDATNRGTRYDLVALASNSPVFLTVSVWREIFKIDLKDDFGIDEGGLLGKDELPDVLNDLDKEKDYLVDRLEVSLEKSK